MKRHFTLEYWVDDGWDIGKLREVPGIFSQSESLEELEANIQDAYLMMVEEMVSEPHPGAQTKDIVVDIA